MTARGIDVSYLRNVQSVTLLLLLFKNGMYFPPYSYRKHLHSCSTLHSALHTATVPVHSVK